MSDMHRQAGPSQSNSIYVNKKYINKRKFSGIITSRENPMLAKKYNKSLEEKSAKPGLKMLEIANISDLNLMKVEKGKKTRYT